MISRVSRRILLDPAELHVLCAFVFLCSCAPILFTEICPNGTEKLVVHYAGVTLFYSFCASAALMVISAATHMMRLNNTRALWQFLKWGLVWCVSGIAFIFVALLADVPPPVAIAKTADPIQTTDTLHLPNEVLAGPASLVIQINPERQQAETIARIPNLKKLESEHKDILWEYLDASPRWSARRVDDTFYSKPGHIVMVPPSSSGTVPGMAHVAFRQLVGGDPMPVGYTVVKPGDPMPHPEEGDRNMPDLALDLGKELYLLLAWRGATHHETAAKAINAAISAVDARMEALAAAPERETINHLITGKDSYTGDTPAMHLCEPFTQEGTYQAEIFVNPGEAGTLLLYIKDLESNRTIRLLNCPAKYSDNRNELFRHDIPGSVPQWLRQTVRYELNNIFPEGTPLFVIRKGKTHDYFGAAFEVWFKPADITKENKLLLRRCYKVQPYESSNYENPAN